jgi:hypothetical protein
MEMKKSAAAAVVVDYLVLIIITFGVVIILFNRMATISPPTNSDTYKTFYSLTNGMGSYYDFKTAWKPRLFANGLAAFTARVSDWLLAKTSIPVVKNPAELTIALWTVSWFILICFLLIWFFKRRALFYIFGIFAGISFGYLSRLHMAVRVYPWDMPPLFFFTLFVLLFSKKKYWWIFALLPISVGFKETTLILCVAFLFMELPWRQRLGMLLGALALSVGVKIFIDYFVHAPMFFTMETKPGDSGTLYLLENFNNLKDITPFFINAGTLIAFFILPNANKNIFFLKLIAIPFILGTFLFGNMIEYRIWFEMIPFALYALDVNIYGDPLQARMDTA